MIKSRTYPGIEGNYSIVAPELAFVRILGVKRDGLGYDVFQDITPSNRRCLYNPIGEIVFDIPFINGTGGPSGTSDIATKVFVLWEE